MSNGSGSPSLLKVVERQKRRESSGGRGSVGSSGFNSSSSRGLPQQQQQQGAAGYAERYDGGSLSRSRNGGSVEPLSLPGTSRVSSRRSDAGGSVASDSSFARDPFRSTAGASFLDASFVSAGKLNGDGGSYLRPTRADIDPYGRDMSFRSESYGSNKDPSSARAEAYSREFAAAASARRTELPLYRGRGATPSTSSAPSVPVAPLESRKPVDESSQSSSVGKTHDAYGRDISKRAEPTSKDERSRNLAAWTRPALEARVETLERLLAEQQTNSSSYVRGDDRELAEHLQVTVRKNRELRAELEVTKTRLATLVDEREAFAQKLEKDNDSLQTLLEEAQRAKEALGNCIKALSAEKSEMANRLALAEDEIIRLKALAASAAPAAAIIQFDEVRGNIEDVAVINEGLKESLRQMQLKNPSFSASAGTTASTEVDSADQPQFG